MRRLFSLFALLALSLSAAAWADVTLRYKAQEQGGPALIVAVADGGQARIELTEPNGSSPATLITRDGIGYVVARDGQGPFVARQDDLVALFAEMMSGMGNGGPVAMLQSLLQVRFELRAAGTATVGGRQGNVYRIVPAGAEGAPAEAGAGAAAETGAGPPIEAVISTDADIAPAGREVVRLFRLMTSAMNRLLGATPDLFAKVDELLARGTLLRAGEMLTLDSVSGAPIPASAFALPGPVLTREQLAARMPRPPAPAPAPAADANSAADMDLVDTNMSVEAAEDSEAQADTNLADDGPNSR